MARVPPLALRSGRPASGCRATTGRGRSTPDPTGTTTAEACPGRVHAPIRARARPGASRMIGACEDLVAARPTDRPSGRAARPPSRPPCERRAATGTRPARRDRIDEQGPAHRAPDARPGAARPRERQERHDVLRGHERVRRQWQGEGRVPIQGRGFPIRTTRANKGARRATMGTATRIPYSASSRTGFSVWRADHSANIGRARILATLTPMGHALAATCRFPRGQRLPS